MSFKREGDDKSQLNILKKRRVADLLSNFIPEDEAALMKNGRYTCLVCSYRPVFDTVDMLTVHRKGKRHLDGLKAFYGKKSQLKNEITKRQHINYVQAEDSRQECSSSAPLLAQTRRLTHHALLKTVPYNSCHRKRSTNLEKGSASISSGPRACSNEQEKTCLKAQVSSDVSPDSSSGFTAANTDHLDQVCLSSQQLADTPDQGDQQRELENQQDSSSRGPGLDTPGNNGLQSAVTQEAELTTAQRRKELEHYLKLKSDGWIRDQSGQWIKDENVEFDSDEDEPPPLNLQPASH